MFSAGLKSWRRVVRRTVANGGRPTASPRRPVRSSAVACERLEDRALLAGTPVVLDFEDLWTGQEEVKPLPSGYAGFTWSSAAYAITKNFLPGSGYDHGTLGNVSLYTAFAADISMGGRLFDFDSAYVTAAWDATENVVVEGWRNGVLRDSVTITTHNDAAYLFDFGFEGVDSVWFRPEGQQIAIDDISIALSPGPVNAAPTLTNVALTPVVAENGVATLSGTIGDADAADFVTSYTLTVDWGDGTPVETFHYAAGTTDFSETHTYLDDAPSGTASDTYSVGLTLVDSLGAAATPPGVGFGPGAVFEADPNDSLVDAQNLDAADWTLRYDADVGDTSANTSTRIPHVTVLGTGDDTVDVYSFTVAAPGTRGIFDLDYAYDFIGNDFDSWLTLYDGDGAILWSGDDAPSWWGQGGSASGLDSYFEYTFAAAGTYYIEVGSYPFSQPIPSGADYRLQVSLGVSPQITVENVAPNAEITGAPESSPEGTAISLGGSVSDPGTLDTHEFYWNVTRDGFYVTGGYGAAFAFTPDDDGTYVVALTAFDDDGGYAFAERTITVTDVMPTTPALTLSPPTADEGGIVTLTGTFEGPGSADAHEVVIDWGDGTTTTIGRPTVPISQGVEFEGHRYHVIYEQDISWFEAEAQAGRMGGHLASIDSQAENDFVAQLVWSQFGYPALAWLGLNDAAVEGDFTWSNGDPVGYTNWFAGEPNDYPPVMTEDFAVMNWGEYGRWGDLAGEGVPGWGIVGVIEVGPERTFTARHRYADDGPSPGNGTDSDVHTITVVLTDDDGNATAPATASVTVENVAPSIAGLSVSDAVVNEDGSVTLTGILADPGHYDEHELTVDWGDGTVETVTLPALAAAATVRLSEPAQFGGHTYVAVLDQLTWSEAEEEARRLGGHLVAIGDAEENLFVLQQIRETFFYDATTWIGLTDEAQEGTWAWSNGEPVGFTSWLDGEPNDFNGGEDHVGINWGASGRWNDFAADARWFAVIELDGTRTFSLTHRYLDDNPTGTPSDAYTLSVTVRDDDGGADSDSASVTVTNVAPEIGDVSNPASELGVAAEGGAVTIGFGFTDVGTLDTHTVTVDWGDGSAAQTFDASDGVTQGDGFGSFAGSHAYGAGVYDVAVTLRDDDGGSAVWHTSVVVSGVGLSPDGETLYVIGTGAADKVTVNTTRGGAVYRAHADFLSDGAAYRDVAAAGVSRIVVLLGGGDDQATVAGSVSATVLMDGGDGDDRLNGGGGPNLLFGGAGNDSLIGGSRRDLLVGGNGADRIVGNGGNDFLVGGRTAYDPDGRRLTAGFADVVLRNTLPGVADASLRDWLVSVAVDDDETGAAGRDVLTGSSGSDSFFWESGEDELTDKAFAEFELVV